METTEVVRLNFLGLQRMARKHQVKVLTDRVDRLLTVHSDVMYTYTNDSVYFDDSTEKEHPSMVKFHFHSHAVYWIDNNNRHRKVLDEMQRLMIQYNRVLAMIGTYDEELDGLMATYFVRNAMNQNA